MAIDQTQLRTLLIEAEVLSAEQFDDVASRKEVTQIGIEDALTQSGLVTEEQLGQLLSLFYDVPFVNLQNREINADLVQRIPEMFARAHALLPLEETETLMTIATSNPENLSEQSLIEKYIRKEVKWMYATPRDIRAHMFVFQKDPKAAFESILAQATLAQEMDTRVIQLVSSILDYAFQAGASDVHIEPEEHCSLIRFREDGVLHDIAELPVSFHEHLLTRLKVLARLATDEHRLAQDGKIVHKTNWGDTIEIRLSLIPTIKAEKAVMRLLSDKSHTYSLADLGLSTTDYKAVSDVVHKPWGAILVTGPTGSGKTTTLYAILRVLNQRGVNITTIEDPVEFDIEGLNQIQVNEKTGLTFASGLRSIVRQDPDIIMVGEIRDSETADIAVNAAMTGHLVLSTIHTNDSATSFPRLQDMNVEDFLIASTVNLVIAQRLVRKNCISCLTSVTVDKTQQELIEHVPHIKKYLTELTGKKIVKSHTLFRGKGCHICHGTGFKGRIGVFEVLNVTDSIRTAIMEKKHADEIHKIAVEEGMTTMLYDGLRKMVAGQTTLEEVLRVTKE